MRAAMRRRTKGAEAGWNVDESDFFEEDIIEHDKDPVSDSPPWAMLRQAPQAACDQPWKV